MKTTIIRSILICNISLFLFKALQAQPQPAIISGFFNITPATQSIIALDTPCAKNKQPVNSSLVLVRKKR